jgi:phospholipase A1
LITRLQHGPLGEWGLGLVAGVVAVAGPAVAGTPGESCLAIADAAQRLACFDREIGAAARGPAEETKAPLPGTTSRAEPRTAPAATPIPSLLDAAWGFAPESRKAYVRLYQPNYLLFARYTNDVNREPYEPLFEAFADNYDFEAVEAKFQISFKGRLATTEDRRWGLWFAYTQQNQWQIYSPDISRPFRETNYMPELFGSFRPGVELGGFKWNLLNFGFNHQSNGRADPISRSWDRLFVEAGIERDDFAVVARAWTRIEESNVEDDNPDITDYLGHGQITALYRWHDNTFTLMGRGNVSTGKGAAQFSWMSRPLLGPMRAYFQVFSGYGESMIDYDWNQTTIGLGVTLNEML